jgi:iron complex transport system ATP-binding protein
VSLDVARGRDGRARRPERLGKVDVARAARGHAPSAAGTIAVAGRPIADYERRALARLVAVVPQDTSVTFPYTVAEMVLMGRAPHRPPLGLEAPATSRSPSR